MSNYDKIKSKLAKGWNTWNTRSVLSHVLLPECFSINLCVKEYKEGYYLKEALIGRFGQDDENIHPGAHTYDGSYTQLNMKWRGIELDIQTATDDEELVILVTPLANQKCPCTLVIEPGFLWNAKGSLNIEDNILTACLPTKKIAVHTTKELTEELNIAVQTQYLAVKLDEAIGISTGCPRSIEEIKIILEENKIRHIKNKERFGALSDVYDAMQSCMAWDTIYEPAGKRVVTTVSRLWNIGNGGYVLFCWDTYFAAYMALIDNKELACANAIEITREMTEEGFIPNTSAGSGFKTLDRSQPPVGSLVVREIYRKYREKWFLEELFSDLLKWNTWYFLNRQIKQGLMSWGSNPYEPLLDNHWETAGVNDTYGGALESGLDNSPMYDDVPFNKENHVMELYDVGLTGLYIMDCHALSDIALILGKGAEAAELMDRAARCEAALDALWNEETGFFLNKRSDTGEFSNRISPTNFYALFSRTLKDGQADKIIKEHFYNTEEFWGEWILPSISRNDPAYSNQNYWRGRIWAPMNLLVYLGLRNQKATKPQKDLAYKSKRLLLKEWLAFGHIHENYCGNTGEGCNKDSSDKFYHWGALLSLIALMEEGYIDGPEERL